VCLKRSVFSWGRREEREGELDEEKERKKLQVFRILR